MFNWFNKNKKIISKIETSINDNRKESHFLQDQKQLYNTIENNILILYGNNNDYINALLFILKENELNQSKLQRHLKIGILRYNKIMDMLFEIGFIGKFNGAKPRKILIQNIEEIEKILIDPKIESKLKIPIPFNDISEDKNEREKRREKIPQNVKDAVWNRDRGECVECGSNEKLEFDHIIPLSRGGSNTYRNLQLLCEPCNRKKSNKIG